MRYFELMLFGAALTTTPFLSAIPQAQQPVETASVLAAQLRRSDELLLTAVHTADRAVWLRFAAPDFFYLDEAGGVTYLDEFLRGLTPMTTKPLQIQSYKLSRMNDTVVVLHEDMDANKVRYIFTETWQRLEDKWKLRVLHITNVLSDPPAIQLSKTQIDELAGTYRSGSDIYIVRRQDNRIFAGGAGAPEKELMAETRDVLFSPGGDPRKRRIFLRDSTGKVTGFVVRYESSDTVWTKEP
jgi:hypothetical protein